jgi:hypothetical protein
MANQTPLKASYTGSDPTGLAEFTTSDTIAVTNGGTGANTANAGRTNLDVYSTSETQTEARNKSIAFTIALG